MIFFQIESITLDNNNPILAVGIRAVAREVPHAPLAQDSWKSTVFDTFFDADCEFGCNITISRRNRPNSAFLAFFDLRIV